MALPSPPCKRWVRAAVLAIATLSAPAGAYSEVISGVIDEWPESGTDLVLGDGVNSVRISWSLQFYDTGYFYGRGGIQGNSEVAALPEVTDVSEITDASTFTFNSYPPSSVGPLCDADCDPDLVGDFVVQLRGARAPARVSPRDRARRARAPSAHRAQVAGSGTSAGRCRGKGRVPRRAGSWTVAMASEES